MERYPVWPNLAAMMFARAREWPWRPMLRHHRDGAWHGLKWGEFARRAAAVARALRAAGVAAGDRVLIVSENRPEVPIAETALMAIRAIVGIGEDAAGKLHLFDGASLAWRTMRLPPDPDCRACGAISS